MYNKSASGGRGGINYAGEFSEFIYVLSGAASCDCSGGGGCTAVGITMAKKKAAKGEVSPADSTGGR